MFNINRFINSQLKQGLYIIPIKN